MTGNPETKTKPKRQNEKRLLNKTTYKRKHDINNSQKQHNNSREMTRKGWKA